MSYKIDYFEEVADDLMEFNKSQKRQIEKAIEKVSTNPLPQNEGGFGKPLGNKRGRNLTGCCKITLKNLGIRVVYKAMRIENIMKIIVVAARADEEVYDIAAKRVNKYGY